MGVRYVSDKERPPPRTACPTKLGISVRPNPEISVQPNPEASVQPNPEAPVQPSPETSFAGCLDYHILTVKRSDATLGSRRTNPIERPMARFGTDVIPGTLDMLILKTLSVSSLHGYGISRQIEEVSEGVFKVNPGSLLTALKRLERSGWIEAEWRKTENSRRAKYYTLTTAGTEELQATLEQWARRSAAVGRLLAVGN